jgi:hypothetical protein
MELRRTVEMNISGQEIGKRHFVHRGSILRQTSSVGTNLSGRDARNLSRLDRTIRERI